MTFGSPIQTFFYVRVLVQVKYRFKPTNPDMAVSEVRVCVCVCVCVCVFNVCHLWFLIFSQSCAVCLDEFEESESILLCPCSCKHGYHKK